MKYCFLMVPILLSGCGGVSVSPTAARVDVTFSISTGGKPVTDMMFNLQPTGEEGLPLAVPVNQGTVNAAVVPGTYTYYMEPGKSAAAYEKLPATYRHGSLDRTVTINGGETIEIKLD